MTLVQMGFDLKKLLKTVSTYNQKSDKIIEVKEEVEPQIILPVYEIDEEIVVPSKKRKKNSEISRKVSLNPLSDE